jgi:LuxR family maltose regulon positive regulatory protein
MSAPLLSTKLYTPPLRPNLVPRTRLIERLNRGLAQGCRLTVVSAPAGYGKTTLITEWLSDLRFAISDLGLAPDKEGARADRVAWLSLDRGDNDPVQFFSYFVAALQTVDERIGQNVQALLDAPQPPPAESLVVTLINDVAAASNPLVLVLDDYHTITELTIHEAMGFLLERQPPQMHLVITTRQDPPLPLSRLRARGQVTEIRENDLRFTPDEVAVFLNQSQGLRLAEEDIGTLEERTEGWIAGLQLAALALQGTLAVQDGDSEGTARFIADFSGRHHFVLDYLTDEILERQPEQVQAFLLQTSILDRMCGSLCDSVVEPDIISSHPSQATLEMLDKNNLFVVPLDDERRWYRYHRLFADLLQARLRELLPDHIPELHRHAATWFEQHELAAEAVHHALATGDFVLAADLVERIVQKVATWSRIHSTTYLTWLSQLPDDLVRIKPWLRLFESRAHYATGQWTSAERIVQELETWLQDNPGPDTEQMLNRLLTDRASYAALRGDVSRAIADAQKILARLPEDATLERVRVQAVLALASIRAGDVIEANRTCSQIIAAIRAADMHFAAVPFACNLADVQVLQGQLRQAAQTCELAVDMGMVDGAPTTSTGFAGLVLGRILYEQNDLPAAERHVLEGLEILRKGGIPASFGIGHTVLARIKQAQGDPSAATAAAQQAVQFAESSGVPRISILASAHQARIWLMQGNLDRAAHWAHDYRQIGETEYLREFEDLTLVRVLLAEGKSVEALDLIDTLLSPADKAGRLGHVIEMLVVRARALQTLGDQDRALVDLERALNLAEPEGYVRVFVDEGESMAVLLRQLASRDVQSGYIRTLLAAFVETAKDEGRKATIFPSTLVEPLTARELEVLHLLADGLTNPEIARQLVISLPTVKSHTRNIYGKLGVHSRKQAVAEARLLGILPA